MRVTYKAAYFIFTPFFFFQESSTTAPGPMQVTVPWVEEAMSPGIKQTGRAADHLNPPSAKVMNVWS